LEFEQGKVLLLEGLQLASKAASLLLPLSNTRVMCSQAWAKWR
jgi:hypothetical protein